MLAGNFQETDDRVLTWSKAFSWVPSHIIHHESDRLGHVYKLAEREWKWATDNPVLKIAKEKVRNLIERWLTTEEEQRLLAVSPTWLQEIIVFALHTGMRRGEILKLHWSHVDLSRRTLTILEQKNGSRDTLPVNDTAMEVLQARTPVRTSRTDAFFLNGAGDPRNARNLLRAFYPAMRIISRRVCGEAGGARSTAARK